MGFGLLSVIQAAFLPGYLILQTLNIRPPSIISTFLLSLGLSQLANYLMVLALVQLGWFGSSAAYAIALLELTTILMLLLRRRSRGSHGSGARAIFARDRTATFIFAVGVLSCAVPAYYFFEDLGNGFSVGDAYFSWHAWALDWYEGRFPYRTWRYPQLMTANWAMMYAVAGTPEVQFFAKSYMAVYPLAIQLTFLELGRLTRDWVYFIGATLYGLILALLTNSYLINDGYADICLSFFCFLSFWSITCGVKMIDLKWLGIGLAFGCAAAVTKQPGLYWLAITTAFLLWRGWRARSKSNGAFFAKAIVLQIGLVAAVVLPWWVYKDLQIRAGIEASEVQVVFAAKWSGLSELAPFERALQTISGNFLTNVPQAAAFVSLVVLVGISLVRRSTWPVALGIVLPFFALWVFTFGYSSDMRNLSLAMPFIALCATQGARVLIDQVNWKDYPTQALPKSAAAISGAAVERAGPRRSLIVCLAGLAVTVLLVIGERLWPISQLAAQQILLQRPLYHSLTAPLYQLLDRGELNAGKVYTTFAAMRVLPGLRHRFAFVPGRFDADLLDRVMGDPTIGYLLIRGDGMVEDRLEYYDIDAATRAKLFEALAEGRLAALAEFSAPWAVETVPGLAPSYNLLRIARHKTP